MNQLRAFIAIDLPKSIQDSIENQTSRLRQGVGNGLVRWVPPANMHLTLKFIGSISTSHVDFLKQMLTQAAESHSPFDLQIGGIGSFPNSKRPRVIWVGIHAPADLAALQKNIEAGAARLGYEKEERSFSPHLTLGRVRSEIAPADLQKIRSTLDNFQLGSIGSARIDAVHLYKSDLHSDGSVYTKLFSVPFKNNAR